MGAGNPEVGQNTADKFDNHIWSRSWSNVNKESSGDCQTRPYDIILSKQIPTTVLPGDTGSDCCQYKEPTPNGANHGCLLLAS